MSPNTGDHVYSQELVRNIVDRYAWRRVHSAPRNRGQTSDRTRKIWSGTLSLIVSLFRMCTPHLHHVTRWMLWLWGCCGVWLVRSPTTQQLHFNWRNCIDCVFLLILPSSSAVGLLPNSLICCTRVNSDIADFARARSQIGVTFARAAAYCWP